MKHIQPLEFYNPEPGEVTLFLAGGIVGVEYNWQKEMVERLSDTNLTLFNPRRDWFDDDDQYQKQEQIRWEYEHLSKADHISFWLPKGALCATSLYEMGMWTKAGKSLFIGIEPGYYKEGGVTKQLALVRPELPIVHSLDDLELLIKGSI